MSNKNAGLITQIYGIRTLEDALMCAELGADHIGIELSLIHI